jgi:pimeloyl-ACP methyl ester carboxylesterase
LLIGLHSAADTADAFAKNWTDLVKSRPDVVVAVPSAGGLAAGVITPAAIKALIDDTVARDHVNPKHVFLVGHDLGAVAAARILGQNPDLFAGYACIAADLDPKAFTPAWQKSADKLAVYYAVGTKDEMFKDVYAPNVLQFKRFRFSRLLTESPATGHALTSEEIKSMMAFFDTALAANDKSAATAAAKK